MQSSDLAGFVINYYWHPSFPPSLRTVTTLCIQMLKGNRCVGRVILVDGSPQPDQNMEEICNQEGIDYLHTGKELTFAQGYNAGWKLLDEQYVGLIANDIFVPEDTIATLLNWIRIDDVGCVFPYLSYSDYPGEIASFVRRPVTCEPTSMTLNINLFKRKVLEEIKGIDEGYLGCFNDVIALMRMRERGYRVVLVGETRVVHIGQMTITKGSTYKKETDVARFLHEYSNYWASHGKWNITRWRWPFSTNRAISIMWWITQNFPSTTVRSWLQWLAMWLEPETTRYPARFGKNKHTRIFY